MKRLFAPVVDGVKLVVKSPAVLLINLFVTALLAAGAIIWLRIEDARTYQLVLGGLLALALVVAWWWLAAGTVAYMYRAARGDSNLRAAYKQGLRRAVLFGVLAMVWIVLWLLLEDMRDFARDFGSLVYSKLSAANRGRIGYQAIHHAFDWTLTIKQWFLLTAVILPWITMLCGAPLNRQSAKDALRTYRRFGYWLGILIAVVIAVWLPVQVLSWRFGTGLEAEMVSLVVRFTLAYVLFIFGWLLALAVSGFASRPDTDVAEPTESAGVGG